MQITVELSTEQAEGLSQFVKRVRHDICRELASNDEEAFAMLGFREQWNRKLG